MCGLAGYVGTAVLDPSRVDTCLRLMGRRGPDHAAWRHWVGPEGRHATLLHTRLNIIDLAARANQPLRVGRKWIGLNGELYNYLELRKELAAAGQSFETESDTEVLLRSIDTDGWGALDRCEGMWAIAVYDEADGSLTLSRDRFGEKPLYLHRDETGLYFGSEAKFIAALTGRRFDVNAAHLYRYLVNGYKSLYKTEETFFEGLRELSPASVLRVGADGSESAWRYWQPTYRPDESLTYDAAVAGVRERLIRSVELRLRADVPLAFCMSGGVDSNALIAIAKDVFAHDVHGFTIVNTDRRYEEASMVECAVAALGIRHTRIPIQSTEFLSRLRTQVRQHDGPVPTISFYLSWQIMAAIAAHGYRISVSGVGADELFTGYYDHHNMYLYEIATDGERFPEELAAWQRHVEPIVRNPFLKNPRAFIDRPSLRDHIFLDADGFSTYLRSAWSEPFTETVFTPDSLLRNRMLNEMFHEAVPVILHADDLNAMYFSIENRSPFLDRELFEFASTIPTRHLVRDGRRKAVLRDALAGLVPEPVRLNPRKVGFNAPVLDFVDLRDPETRAFLLDDGPIFEHLRRDRLEELLGHGDLPNSQSKFLFYFANARMFLEEFAR